MRTRRLLVATSVAGLLLVPLAACSAGSAPEVLSSSPAGEAAGSSQSPVTGGSGVQPEAGVPLAADDITCSSAPESVGTSAEPVTVDCSELHNYEGFEIPGDVLNACVTTIAASSDIVVVPDTDPGDEGELEIDDPRVSGHSYATSGDGVSCQITLAQPQRGALLG